MKNRPWNHAKSNFCESCFLQYFLLLPKTCFRIPENQIQTQRNQKRNMEISMEKYTCLVQSARNAFKMKSRTPQCPSLCSQEPHDRPRSAKMSKCRDLACQMIGYGTRKAISVPKNAKNRVAHKICTEHWNILVFRLSLRMGQQTRLHRKPDLFQAHQQLRNQITARTDPKKFMKIQEDECIHAWFSEERTCGDLLPLTHLPNWQTVGMGCQDREPCPAKGQEREKLKPRKHPRWGFPYLKIKSL